MDKNLLVYRSSAGSGKTFTLVKEYLKLLLQEPKTGMYKHILAITFTNKATSEMKERVLQSLKNIAQDHTHSLCKLLSKELHISPLVVQERAEKNLSHILHHYSDLSILTIDKFIYKVARSFFIELGLSHNLSVELDGESILEIAVDELLQKIGTHPGITQFFQRFLNSAIQNEKSWNIEAQILELSKLLLNEDSQHYLNANKNISYEELQGIHTYIQQQLKAFERSYGQLLTQGHQITKNIEYEAFKQGRRSSVKTYFERMHPIKSRYEPLKIIPSASIQNMCEEGLFYSPKASSLEKEQITQISEPLQQIFEQINHLIHNEVPHYALFQLLEQSIFPMYILSSVKTQLDSVYKSQQIIHLSEFSKKIASIIHQEPVPFIYERVGEKYKHFLLDEFQDTSALQWHNMLPLIDESLANGKQNLLVGDGKQAIYRWRGGEVSQFTHLPQLPQNNNQRDYTRYQSAIQHNFTEKNLGSNWRSATGIVEFNNGLFKSIRQHLPPHLQNIYTAHHQNPEKSEQGYVHLEKIETQDTHGTLLLHIQNCLNDGFNLRDITILARNNKDLVLFSIFLTEHNIPIQSSESLLLKEYSGIKQIIAFYHWLNNPQSKEKRMLLATELQALQALDSQQMQTLIHQKGALEKHLHQHYNIDFNTLHVLSVYEGCLYLCNQFNPNMSQNAYMTAFLDLVFHYQSHFNASIHGFLNFWKKRQSKASVQSDQQANAVKLMTIHKSKGLEFPVVMLPILNWTTSKGNKTEYTWVPNHIEELSNLKYLLLPVKKELSYTPYSSYYEKEQEDTLLDNINLLYVALTRATTRLYGFYSKNNNLMQYVEPYLQQTEYWNPSLQSYTYGIPKKNTQEPLPKEPALVPTYPKANWREKIVLSYAHEKAQINQHTAYGTLIHEILGAITHQEQVPQVIQQGIKTGLIPTEMASKITENILQIIQHPVLAPYYQENTVAKNEQAFIDQSGQVRRADKVVYLADKIILIDYKTGAPKKADLTQINQYKSAYQQMGHAHVQGILFYTESKEVVYV